MRSEKNLKSFMRTAVNWRYLGLGIAIIAILTVGLQFADIYKESKEEGKIELSLKIEYGESIKENLIVENHTTAFQVLNKTHKVEYKEYPLGYFITGIDGIRQNETHSWLYFVNDSVIMESSDKYYLSYGDVLTFKFLSSEESMKYFK